MEPGLGVVRDDDLTTLIAKNDLNTLSRVG
jgi:hypothetical protein